MPAYDRSIKPGYSHNFGERPKGYLNGATTRQSLSGALTECLRILELVRVS